MHEAQEGTHGSGSDAQQERGIRVKAIRALGDDKPAAVPNQVTRRVLSSGLTARHEQPGQLSVDSTLPVTLPGGQASATAPPPP